MIGFQNEWRGVGRLTADVELRKTPSDISVCNFSIAVDRPGTNRENKITDFFECVAWRQTAEMINKHFKKGDPMAIIGSLQTDKFTDKDGNNRSKVEICVDQIFFLPRQKVQEQQGQTDESAVSTEETAPAMNPLETDELPF